VVQGVITEIRGGKFSAGLSSAFVAKVGGHYFGGNKGAVIVLGGLASKAAGGDFVQGTVTAAMVYLYNDQLDVWNTDVGDLTGEQPIRHKFTRSSTRFVRKGIVDFLSNSATDKIETGVDFNRAENSLVGKLKFVRDFAKGNTISSVKNYFIGFKFKLTTNIYDVYEHRYVTRHLSILDTETGDLTYVGSTPGTDYMKAAYQFKEKLTDFVGYDIRF
jgi:hypothetical protein